MNVRVRVVFNNFPQLTGQMRYRASQVVRKTAFDIQGNAQASMSGHKSGQVYERYGRAHQASAPGEAPAIDTGYLQNSIAVEMLSDLQAIVFTNALYAEYLEFGTARMAPRPYMVPAAERAWPGFLAAMGSLA